LIKLSLSTLPKSSNQKTGWPWTKEDKNLPSIFTEDSSWPRISIVTPSYNQGLFIEETIRSVLLQDYPNLEYIIIDGGSNDNSVEIIRKYEPWLTYWKSEPDRGQSHAINKGFVCATGDILAWLNSDDIYAPGVLIHVAEKLGGKNNTLLVGSSTEINEQSQFTGKLDERKPHWEEILYDVSTFPQPSVFWTRDLWLSTGGLDEPLHLMMDYDLWLRMQPYVEQIIFSDLVYSSYRRHPGQKGARLGLGPNGLAKRAGIARRAARLRGEPVLKWLGRVWLLRIKKATNLYHIYGSGYHWQVLREVLTHSSEI
jgi:glycosyltransferase involved in cell wall biosynthesis